MADNEEDEATPRTGNEWEVVQLTASAYNAAPSSDPVDSTQDNQSKLGEKSEVESSGDMFMSGHFVFPPNQHENLPVEPEYSEIDNENGSDDDVSELVEEEGENLDLNDDENLNIEATGYSSFHSEATISKSSTVNESEGIDVSVEPFGHEMDSGMPNLSKPVKGEDRDGSELPCEAWWKRRAISIYVHAKEANTFWSIIIAAAVMGLVVIGHRWQDLHLRWQFGNNERMSRMLGPVSQFKDVIVGGHRRGSLIHGSFSTER